MCSRLRRRVSDFTAFCYSFPCVHRRNGSLHAYTPVDKCCHLGVPPVRENSNTNARRRGSERRRYWARRMAHRRTLCQDHCATRLSKLPQVCKGKASPGERFLHSAISWHSFLRFCVAAVQRFPLTAFGPTLAPAPLCSCDRCACGLTGFANLRKWASANYSDATTNLPVSTGACGPCGCQNTA